MRISDWSSDVCSSDLILNFAQNLLRFDDERVALLFRGEDGRTERISYAELRRRVAALAAALRTSGVGIGDREIGRAHVRTPVTNAHLVCRRLLETNKVSIW